MPPALRMTPATTTDSDLQKSVIQSLASDPRVDETAIGVSVPARSRRCSSPTTS
jgi:hypothetical protein